MQSRYLEQMGSTAGANHTCYFGYFRFASFSFFSANAPIHAIAKWGGFKHTVDMAEPKRLQGHNVRF